MQVNDLWHRLMAVRISQDPNLAAEAVRQGPVSLDLTANRFLLVTDSVQGRSG